MIIYFYWCTSDDWYAFCLLQSQKNLMTMQPTYLDMFYPYKNKIWSDVFVISDNGYMNIGFKNWSVKMCNMYFQLCSQTSRALI